MEPRKAPQVSESLGKLTSAFVPLPSALVSFFLFLNIYLFILAVPGLSCGTRDL